MRFGQPESLGSASAHTRVCSTSPMWRPQRISSPSDYTALRMAFPQGTISDFPSVEREKIRLSAPTDHRPASDPLPTGTVNVISKEGKGTGRSRPGGSVRFRRASARCERSRSVPPRSGAPQPGRSVWRKNDRDGTDEGIVPDRRCRNRGEDNPFLHALRRRSVETDAPILDRSRREDNGPNRGQVPGRDLTGRPDRAGRHNWQCDEKGARPRARDHHYVSSRMEASEKPSQRSNGTDSQILPGKAAPKPAPIPAPSPPRIAPPTSAPLISGLPVKHQPFQPPSGQPD